MKYLRIIILVVMLLTAVSCREIEVLDLSEGIVDNINYGEIDEVTNFIKIETNQNEVILIELLPDVAPLTVENFQKLIESKFFDGSIFHRVIDGFMIQGGISATDEAAETIQGEFENNGIENDLSHERGVISMARMGHDMNSASSQFFIMHQDTPFLDKDYAGFGRVIAGMDVVDRIATTRTAPDPRSGEPKPVVDQVIRSIRFVTIQD